MIPCEAGSKLRLPIYKSACASLYSDLDPASRALMLSQAGPGGSLAITVLPTAPVFRMPSSHMRVRLLRRLRQPLQVRWRSGSAGRPPSSPPHSRRQAAAGHVVGAAHVRQKLFQRRRRRCTHRPPPAAVPAESGPVPAARRWPACPSTGGERLGAWLNAGGRALHVLSPRRACAETLPPQPRTARPPRCPPPLACTGKQPPVPGTFAAACDWPQPRPRSQLCDQHRDGVPHRASMVTPRWCQRRLAPPATAAGRSLAPRCGPRPWQAHRGSCLESSHLRPPLRPLLGKHAPLPIRAVRPERPGIPHR